LFVDKFLFVSFLTPLVRGYLFPLTEKNYHVHLFSYNRFELHPSSLKKIECKRAVITFFDKVIKKEVTQPKQVPILIRYTLGKKSTRKSLTKKICS
ncbi:hypothetical protein QUF75_20905, partial [Desulfococcaceae bacterium HSG7]|nr:hypothetical protein [Desulfococcaceae bacterium HSG7]